METLEKAPPKTGSKPATRPNQRGFTVRWRNPERSLVDYVTALWVRRYVLLVLTGVSGFLGLLHAVGKPNTFAASATVMVHSTGSVQTTADAAASIFGTGTIPPTQVTTAIDVIKSRVVLRRVVERVGYRQILRAYDANSAAVPGRGGLLEGAIDRVHALQTRVMPPAKMNFARYAEAALVGAAIDLLDERLFVDAPTRGSTVDLTFLHTSPDGAAKILRAIVDESVRRFSDVVSPPEGKDWIEVKVAAAAEEEAAAEAALEAFSREHGTTDLTQEILALTRSSATVIGNMTTAKMRQDEAKTVLKSLQDEFAKPSARSSAKRYSALEEGIRTRELELIDLNAQVPLFQDSLDTAQTTLVDKRRLQRRVDRLHTDVRRAREQHEQLQQIRKTYEINSELDVRGLTYLRVVEPADVPRLRDGPRRGTIVLGAAIGALALGISIILLRVRMNRRLMNMRDAMFALGRSDVVATPLLTEQNLQRFEDARRRGWE